MAIGNISRDLELENGIGTMNHITGHSYLGNHEAKVNKRVNKDISAISNENGVLWDQNMNPTIKIQLYHALVKSTTTYTEYALYNCQRHEKCLWISSSVNG